MIRPGRNGPPLVLVADDEEDIVELLAVDLQAEGYEVVLARDGEEAVRLAHQHRPDIALIDVVMPKLDGYEVTRRIRNESDGVRVVLLTARAQVADVLRGFRAGADDYITKPFSTEELRTRLQALLGRR
jgi:two-component system OmpR family response regulator